jgi:glutamyl-tRNA reductase
MNELNQSSLNIALKEKFGNKLDSFFGLSTCNRTEVYLLADPVIAEEIMRETKLILGINDIPDTSFYSLYDQDALVHMSKVASGIDSQVLGEQEIFGQFKRAISIAKEINIISSKLLSYSDKVLEIVKKTRTKTDIGLNPLSVSGLSLKLIKNIFENPKDQNVLILGAGNLAQAVIDNLHKSGITQVKAINRSVKKIIISESLQITPLALNKLHDELEHSDIVIASAATEIPLIGKGAIENALKARKNKPMLLIDLSVPRNIEEEIKEIEQIYLFTIDDIEKITQDNFGQRQIEAEKALNMIVIDSQTALFEIKEKLSKDKIKNQLESFLSQLSEEEINRFKSAEDLKQMIANLAVIKLEDKTLKRVLDIENLEPHVIESMFKRYIENA